MGARQGNPSSARPSWLVFREKPITSGINCTSGTATPASPGSHRHRAASVISSANASPRQSPGIGNDGSDSGANAIARFGNPDGFGRQPEGFASRYYGNDGSDISDNGSGRFSDNGSTDGRANDVAFRDEARERQREQEKDDADRDAADRKYEEKCREQERKRKEDEDPTEKEALSPITPRKQQWLQSVRKMDLVEKRLDADGLGYTFAEFIEYYGSSDGRQKWVQAQAEDPSPAGDFRRIDHDPTPQIVGVEFIDREGSMHSMKSVRSASSCQTTFTTMQAQYFAAHKDTPKVSPSLVGDWHDYHTSSLEPDPSPTWHDCHTEAPLNSRNSSRKSSLQGPLRKSSNGQYANTSDVEKAQWTSETSSRKSCLTPSRKWSNVQYANTSDVEKDEAVLAVNSLPEMTAEVGVIEKIVQQLGSRNGSEQNDAASALLKMARNCENQVAIVKVGAVAPLVRLLQSSAVGGQQHAAGALSNLAANETNRILIAEAGAIAPLVTLLASTASRAQQHAAGALSNLAANDDNTVLIAQAGAIGPLVRLVAEDCCDEVQERAAAALGNLVANEDNAISAAAAGAIQPLVILLSDASASVREQAVGAIRNLSINCDNKILIAKAGAIEPLVGLLGSNTVGVQEHAAGALWNLAVNADNSIGITKAGATDPLLRLLGTNPAVQEQALGVLKILAVSRRQLRLTHHQVWSDAGYLGAYDSVDYEAHV